MQEAIEKIAFRPVSKQGHHEEHHLEVRVNSSGNGKKRYFKAVCEKMSRSFSSTH